MKVYNFSTYINTVIHKSKVILLVSAILLGIYSCNDDFMERYPLDSISGEVYFRTENDLQQYIYSFYSYLPGTSIYTGDKDSDNLDVSTLSELMLGTSTIPSSASDAGWTWADVRNINYFLERYHKAEVTDAVKNHYAGIARFFRALVYFEKVKKFGDVPFYSNVLTTTSNELYKARDKRNVVVDSIIADLDFAALHINNIKDNSNVSSGAALALKSRVCLYEGTWEKYHQGTVFGVEGSDGSHYLRQAADAASKLIATAKYKLYNTGNPTKDYLNLFASQNGNTDEYILKKTYSDAYGVKHGANGVFTSATLGNYSVTRDLVENYLTSDGKPYSTRANYDVLEFKDEVANRDPRLSQTIRTPGYVRINNNVALNPNFLNTFTGYQGVKFVTTEDQDAFNSNTNDLPVLRYAEVLLNYAEAKAELGELTQNDINISINLIRARAGMPSFNLNSIPLDPILRAQYSQTSDDLILAVRRERRVELALEGFRRDDLLRWREGDVLAKDFRGMYFTSIGLKDLNGDGVNDLEVRMYKTSTNNASLQYLDLAASATSQSSFGLSNGSSGFLNIHPHQRKLFDENKDYLSPLPTTEILLNPNLEQNPNWKYTFE